MQINISLNKKSIGEAIQLLKKQRDRIDSFVSRIIEKSLKKIEELANARLMSIDIGSNLKTEIMSSWEIERTGNIWTLKNTNDKAVYVEFGVGTMGLNSPHPNAQNALYEYNILPGGKDIDGVWAFFVNTEDLDLPKNYVGVVKSFNDSRNRAFVQTMGSPANMYLFNAYMDFKEGNYLKDIIQAEKERFWK